MTDGSLISLVRFFGFHSFESRGIAFYRPLFREITYNLSYGLWGLNPIPLRILSMILHFSNVVLIFALVKKIFKSEKTAYLTAFLFSISAANVGAIYYLAGGLQAQGAALFVFCTLLLFPKHKILAFLTFIFSLMSHEIAVVTPVLLTGYMILNRDFKFKYLLPYFVTILLYFYGDYAVIGFSKNEIQYKPTFNPKTLLNSISWYSLWAFGIPETLIDFVGPGLKLNPNLMKYWGDLYRIIFPAFFISLLSFLLILVSKIKNIRKLKIKREIIFLVFWFLVGISTVLLFPFHKSTYYMCISLPAFWGVISYFIFQNSKINIILSIVFLVSVIVLNIYSTKNMDITYWAAERGRVSERLLSSIKDEYPKLPKGSILIVKNDPNYPFLTSEWGGTSKQASLILSGSDALQLFYRDPELKVYYEDLGGIPNDTKSSNIVEFVAKIN